MAVVFEFLFTADLHTAAGRNIAAAAHAQLRSGEIDNLWKDRVGRGWVGSLTTSISRTNNPNEWTVLARASGGDGYDRDEAIALRQAVLAALRENAERFEEWPSDLAPGS